jgi:hypothetical protein
LRATIESDRLSSSCRNAERRIGRSKGTHIKNGKKPWANPVHHCPHGRWRKSGGSFSLKRMVEVEHKRVVGMIQRTIRHGRGQMRARTTRGTAISGRRRRRRPLTVTL